MKAENKLDEAARLVNEKRARTRAKPNTDGDAGNESPDGDPRPNPPHPASGGPKKQAASNADGATCTPRFFSKIKSKPFVWAWKNRIHYNGLSLIEAPPDQGKSTLTLFIAAALSKGEALPCSPMPKEPVVVAIMALEDDEEEVVINKITASGADQDRVAHIPDPRMPDGSARPWDLDTDIPMLRKALTDVKAKVLIVDSLMSTLDSKVNTNNDASSRRPMLKLKQLAKQMGLAIICIRHLRKDETGSAINRGGGSIAFSAIARSVLRFGTHPEDPDKHVMAIVKANSVKKADRRSFEFEMVSHRLPDGSDWPRLNFIAECDVTVEDMDSAGKQEKEEGPKVEEAKAAILVALASGPMASDKLNEAILEQGVKKAARNRARAQLKKDKEIAHRRLGGNGDWWVSLSKDYDKLKEKCRVPVGSRHGADLDDSGDEESPITPSGPTQEASHQIGSMGADVDPDRQSDLDLNGAGGRVF